MNRRSSWMGGSLLAALVFGLLAVPEADARGGAGRRPFRRRTCRVHRDVIGRSTEHSRRLRSSRRRCPMRRHRRGATPRGGQVTDDQQRRTHANNATTACQQRSDPSNNARPRTERPRRVRGQPIRRATRRAPRSTTTLSRTTTPTAPALTPATTGPTATVAATATAIPAGATATGGRRATTARSSRGSAPRTRTLARIDNDYQGHRVRAMHSISMAVRQLSHRSMVYGQHGFRQRHEQQHGDGAAARRPERKRAGAAERNGMRTGTGTSVCRRPSPTHR